MLIHSQHPIPFASSPLSAGPGFEAYDEYEQLDLNHLATRGKHGCKSYKITGDSAVPRIHPGSIVIVDPSMEPRNGSIVAAWRNGLNYVKVLKLRPKLQLVSPNSRYEPVDIEEFDDFYILGVIRGVWQTIEDEYFIPTDSLYTVTSVAPTGGGLIHAQFEGDHGDHVEIYLAREEVVKGIKMAVKALKNIVTNTIRFPKT